MKVLVDITHPAHVHFFKYAIEGWQARGHQVIITSRDKDLTLCLLDRYEFRHTTLSQARKGVMGLGLEMLERGRKLWDIVRSERPAVLTGVGGTFIAPIGKLTGTPVVIFTDTEHARVANAIAFPLADAICTPACYEDQIGRKQVTYSGYQELAYLHPSRFTPDQSQLQPFDVSPEEPYIVMRLVAWASGHDIGDRGLTDLKTAVETLSCYGRVLISSEDPLPPDLSHYGVTVSPEQIHHLLAFATLYIGESATMASESAILGVPSIFVSTSTRGYTNEQGRKYGLVYTFSDPQIAQRQALEKAVELLRRPNSRAEWQIKREKMLNEMTDVTAFIVDIVKQHAKAPIR
jgi:predicted glycosyltransferase